MMDVVGAAQVLLLATVLIGAGLAKLLVHEPPPERPAHVHGVPVPPDGLGWALTLRRSRPLAMALGLAETGLGVALLASPHVAVRATAALLLAAATWVVAELRERTPDAGCGCFGGLSTERVGRRNIVRAAALTAVAVGTLGGTDAGVQIALTGSWQVWALYGLELGVLAALSPEPAELLRRRRRPAVPCERRPVPLAKSQAILRRSDPWRRHRRLLTAGEPLDVWREGCWRFLAYPAEQDGRELEIVFAVSTDPRDRTVLATALDAERPAPAEPLPAPVPSVPAPSRGVPVSPEVFAEDADDSGPHYVMSR